MKPQLPDKEDLGGCDGGCGERNIWQQRPCTEVEQDEALEDSREQYQTSAQRFLTTHAAIYNTFYVQPHLIPRPSPRHFRAEAHAAWAASAG